MAESSKPPKAKKKTQKTRYQDIDIEVTSSGVTQTFKVDGKNVEIHQDPDTGSYVCHEAPYQQFGSLEELGKAIIDCRKEQSDYGEN